VLVAVPIDGVRQDIGVDEKAHDRSRTS
jgi:hypothetical protein